MRLNDPQTGVKQGLQQRRLIGQKLSGASLIETMIAVALVGFGLLGMAALQAKAIVMNQSAYYRGVAADLGADLADRIRALRSPFLSSVDAVAKPAKPPDFSKCSLNDAGALVCAEQESDEPGYGGPHRSAFRDLVNAEMTEWDGLRRSQMPAGSRFSLTAETGASALGAASNHFRYTLRLSWVDNRQSSDATTSYTMVIE